MSGFKNIPHAEWRKLMADISFLKESIKVLTMKGTHQEWVSEKQAMELLNVKDHRTMRKIAQTHHIAVSAASNRGWKYKMSDINNYLNANAS